MIPKFPELPITDLSTTDDRYEIIIYQTPDHRIVIDIVHDIDHRNTDLDCTPIHTLIINNPFL